MKFIKNFGVVFFLAQITSYTILAQKRIYITTAIPGWWTGNLFDRHSDGNRQPHREPMYFLKKRLESLGYTVIEPRSLDNVDDADFVVIFDLPPRHSVNRVMKQFQRIPKKKLMLFLWEPPSVMLHNYDTGNHHSFSKIYTWWDDLVDNERYFKFYYPCLQSMIDDTITFKEKKLCTFIAGDKSSSHKNELYSARRKTITFFEELGTNEFDFYGRGWSGHRYKNYKGQVRKKLDVLKKYRFCICYENIKKTSGYITEKIFDCFQAGCIPVYWGASNIADYIPKNCFIAREEFKDEKHLYNFMKNMSEKEYNHYIENIKKYLQSDQAQLYSIENFINIFLQAIGHDEEKLLF